MDYTLQDIKSAELFLKTGINAGIISARAMKSMLQTLKQGVENHQEEKFLAIKDIQEKLSLSRMTVLRLIDSGQLTKFKIGLRAVRIPQSSLTAYLERIQN